jgi:hypothetical protein
VLDQLTYLFEIYWPYAAGALVIGLVSGWFSISVARK